MRYLSFVVITMLMLSAVSRADVIRLKDGTVLNGDVKRAGGGAWTITGEDGKVTRVEANQVKSLEMGNAPSTKPGAPHDEKLASLRRSIESLSDINQILERYQRFIESKPGEAALREAEKDVALWRQRLADGLVKFNGQWITRQQRRDLEKRAVADAQQARDLLRQGRKQEAETLLRQAIEADPGSPPARYLLGVLLFEADKLVESRKCFEAVLDVVPEHGPTLANLGVILWRLEAVIPAINYHTQAMDAAPLERPILNNVAEVIELIPKKHRDEVEVQRMTDRFVTQDRELQDRLVEQGLYRWGATWVDREQMDMLEAAEADIREKLGDLEEQFDRIQDRIARIEEDISANKREMRRLESTRYFRSRDGRLVQGNLPSLYYDLREDNEELEAERDEQEQRQDELRATAEDVESRLPVPRFTGVLKILGIEYAPMPIDENPPPATTSTTTKPS